MPANNLKERPDGLVISSKPVHKFSFHGSKQTEQRASAAQAVVDATAVAGAAGANPTQAEYAVAVAKINALVVLANELRAALVEKGLIAGGSSQQRQQTGNGPDQGFFTPVA